MSKYGDVVLALAASVLLQACASMTPQPSSPRMDAVRAYVAAFNAHDTERMLGMVTADVQWASISGATVHVETTGKAALKAAMDSYFAKCTSCSARLTDMTDTGTRIAVHELAGSKTTPERKSLAVYEFDGALIKRVFYFPLEPKQK
jgi:hypothetical protein